MGRLAESSEVKRVHNEKETREVVAEHKDLRLQNEAADSANVGSGDTFFGESNKFGNLVSNGVDGVEKSGAGSRDSDKRWMSVGADHASTHKVDVARPNASGIEEAVEHCDKHGQKLTSFQELSCEVNSSYII